MLSEKDIDDITTSYFKQNNPFSKHHIDSYNDFIETTIPTMISSQPLFPVTIKRNDEKVRLVEISLKNARPDIPHYTEKNGCRWVLTPQKARLNNITYSLTILVGCGCMYSYKGWGNQYHGDTRGDTWEDTSGSEVKLLYV